MRGIRPKSFSPHPRGDIRHLRDDELERRIGAGLEDWSELQEALLATGGMPPSRQLASRVVDYLQTSYWPAENARAEALRRRCIHLRARSRSRADEGMGIV